MKCSGLHYSKGQMRSYNGSSGLQSCDLENPSYHHRSMTDERCEFKQVITTRVNLSIRVKIFTFPVE